MHVQNLCFTKKIRYESRKQLAKARPRVKGQFVRVDSTDLGDEELEELPEASRLGSASGMVSVSRGSDCAVRDTECVPWGYFFLIVSMCLLSTPQAKSLGPVIHQTLGCLLVVIHRR